jgi:hypothetical protein
MGFLDNLRKDTIELLLKGLKSETNSKKITKTVKALMKYGLTQEDIDARLAEIEEIKKVSSAPMSTGYKKGKNQMYVLSCTHQIRAEKATGLISKGLVGKTVWCDVCNAERLVTGAPYWVK